MTKSDDIKRTDQFEIAMFGMGCFWGPQKLFDRIKGVLHTVVGYAGGEKNNPTYEDLGDHTETIKIVYDPDQISYDDLLRLFFENHDPTTPRKVQYRSVVFPTSEKQKKVAKRKLGDVKDHLPDKVRTSIEQAKNFYRAEDYHQHYLENS